MLTQRQEIMEEMHSYFGKNTTLRQQTNCLKFWIMQPREQLWKTKNNKDRNSIMNNSQEQYHHSHRIEQRSSHSKCNKRKRIKLGAIKLKVK